MPTAWAASSIVRPSRGGEGRSAIAAEPPCGEPGQEAMGGEVGRQHRPATLSPCRSILKGAQPGAGLRPPVGSMPGLGGFSPMPGLSLAGA